MRNRVKHRHPGIALLGFGLLAITLLAQAGPDNRRCLTREQLNIEPLFSACPPLVDQASVSDSSFIATLRINGGPSRYTMRWRGESYFNEDVFTYNEATGLYDGFCATRACSIAALRRSASRGSGGTSSPSSQRASSGRSTASVSVSV